MKTFLALSLILLVPGTTYAWSGLGDAGAGMTVDYNPGVILNATPQTITAGESTYVTLAAPLASDNVTTSPEPDVKKNCTTNFEYDAMPGPGAYEGTTWGTVGAVTDYPTVTKTYTATCRLFQSESASGVTYRYETQSVTVTVTPAPAIDLTANTIPHAVVTLGQPVVLSSLVTNVGTNPTPSGFNTLFQTATDADGTGVQDIGTYGYSSAVPASGNFTATKNHTFPGAGTVYVRACADKGAMADTNGSITESNELNNCSPWSSITIAHACNDEQDNDGDLRFDLDDPGCANDPDGDNESANTPVASLSCTPSNCTGPSGTVSLNYSCTNSTSATLSTFTSPLSPFPSGVKTAPSAGPYQLACTGPGGTNTTSKTVVFTNATAYIEATPDRVNSGGNSTLGFSASQISSSCTVTGPDGTIWSSPNPIVGGTLATTTAPSGKITRQSTFTISCDGGTVTDSVLVNIVPQFDEF